MRTLFRRGQTMVMFALSVLLLVLLVTLTLSLGMKVKEKMEVQAVADAAAYSQAAQTARVFNEMALMSRAQIGHLVSQAAVQSLIDWSSYYRAQVGATVEAYFIAMIPYIALLPCCIPFSGCTSFCSCAIRGITDIARSQSMLQRYDSIIGRQWDALEMPATQRSRRLSQAAQQMFYLGHAIEYGRYILGVNNQTAAKDIVDGVRQAPWGSEWRVDGKGTTLREVSPYLGAVTWPNLINAHQLYAAMGSRGHSFVANRGLFPTDDLLVATGIARYMYRPDTVFILGDGSTYWAILPETHAAYTTTADIYHDADDHGYAFVTFNRGRPPCPTSTAGIGLADSWLMSSDLDTATSFHFWLPPLGGLDADPIRHDLYTCLGVGGLTCPSVFPSFVDYNAFRVPLKDDAFGQPKNMAVIQRDYVTRGDRADPWNLLFRFRFASNDNPFDNSGIRLGPSGGNLNISRQTALSTGITYYHRRDHWREPPNMLNPYWRATLVPATVDDSGEGDMKDELRGAGVGWAADTYDALRGQGYKGGP